MPVLDSPMSIPEEDQSFQESFSSTESVDFDQDNALAKMDEYGLSLYKTEYCRSFSETGYCRYGSKCRFAHGITDLRPVQRHKKYKTEQCKNFGLTGVCPYGPRCRFVHNLVTHDADELPGLGPVSSLSPFLTGQSFGTSPSERSKDTESVSSEHSREDRHALQPDTSPANSSTSSSPQPAPNCDKGRGDMPFLRLDASKTTVLSSGAASTPTLNAHAQPFTPSSCALREKDVLDRSMRNGSLFQSRPSESDTCSPRVSYNNTLNGRVSNSFETSSPHHQYRASPLANDDEAFANLTGSPASMARQASLTFPSSRSLFYSNEIQETDLASSIRPLTVGASPVVRPMRNWSNPSSSSPFKPTRSNSSTSSSPTSPFISPSPFTPTISHPFSLPGPFQLSSTPSSFDHTEHNTTHSRMSSDIPREYSLSKYSHAIEDDDEDKETAEQLMAAASLYIPDDDDDDHVHISGNDSRSLDSQFYQQNHETDSDMRRYNGIHEGLNVQLHYEGRVTQMGSTVLSSINNHKPPIPPRSSPLANSSVLLDGSHKSSALSSSSPKSSVSPLTLFSSPPLLSGGLTSSLSTPMFSSTLSSSPSSVTTSPGSSRRGDHFMTASPIFGSSSPLFIIDDKKPSTQSTHHIY